MGIKNFDKNFKNEERKLNKKWKAQELVETKN